MTRSPAAPDTAGEETIPWVRPPTCWVLHTFVPVVAFRASTPAPYPKYRVLPTRDAVERGAPAAVPNALRRENCHRSSPVLRFRACVMASLPVTYATPSANPLTPGAEMVAPAPTSLSMANTWVWYRHASCPVLASTA